MEYQGGGPTTSCGDYAEPTVAAELRVAALLRLGARAALALGLDRSATQLGAAIYERGGVERMPAA